MKKFIGTISMLLAAATLSSSIYAATPVVSVVTNDNNSYNIEYTGGLKQSTSPVVLLFIDGDVVADADVVIKNGTTLVPLKVISNKLGAEVSWDGATKTATITKGVTKINVTIGQKRITVNDSDVTISSPAEIINSTTYVPLRAISTAFGSNVGYVNKLDNYDNVKVVYVQDKKSNKVSLSEDGAEKKAEEIYFKKFLPSIKSAISANYNVDVSTVNASNIEAKLGRKFNAKCVADLGEYYYVKLFDVDRSEALLFDKFDGSYYAVTSYSLEYFSISKKYELDKFAFYYQ
jgi:hypothetical protein